jgi:hypothetical protein
MKLRTAEGGEELHEFLFAGYGNPSEVMRYGAGYCVGQPGENSLPVWYLNLAGYAQQFIPNRPPTRMSFEVRVLLLPAFQEK